MRLFHTWVMDDCGLPLAYSTGGPQKGMGRGFFNTRLSRQPFDFYNIITLFRPYAWPRDEVFTASHTDGILLAIFPSGFTICRKQRCNLNKVVFILVMMFYC